MSGHDDPKTVFIITVIKNATLLSSQTPRASQSAHPYLLSAALMVRSSTPIAIIQSAWPNMSLTKCSLRADDLSASFPHVRPRTDSSLSTVRFRETTVETTVEQTLRQLNPTKATGPDGIPARVLKACSAELARPLSNLFTCCLRSGIQPQQWKVANLIPVHKRKSKSSPSNYRLSILSKVMETIVNRAISNATSWRQITSCQNANLASVAAKVQQTC